MKPDERLACMKYPSKEMAENAAYTLVQIVNQKQCTIPTVDGKVKYWTLRNTLVVGPVEETQC